MVRVSALILILLKTSLLVGVIVWDLGPVGSELFEVVEQRSDLFLYVSLSEDGHILLTSV